MMGVEIDRATARISARLYPSARVRNEGFAAIRVPENSFTARLVQDGQRADQLPATSTYTGDVTIAEQPDEPRVEGLPS